MGDNPKLKYVVLSRNKFETFVRKLLLIKQYRVEVYVKDTENENDWLLEYKGSPGNLTQFEELVFENHDLIYTPGVLAINLVKNNTIAAAYVNVMDAQLMVAEFTDNEMFTELEGLVAQISPKECIIPLGGTTELTTLNKILERNGIMVGRAKKSEFNHHDIEQDLNRLVHFEEEQQRNAMSLPETNLSEAMSCLQVIIKYLNLIGDEKCYNHFKLIHFDIHRYVHMDNTAIAALNLFPTPGTSFYEQAGKNKFVFGLLDKCCTRQGRRLLEQWMKQPLRDINRITERMEVVEALVNDTESRQTLHSNCLTRVPDILMLTKKLSSKKMNLHDCYRIYQTVSNVPPILDVLQRLDNKYVRTMLIDPITDLMVDVGNYQGMIEHTLNFDLVDRGEYLIKPDFNEELQDLTNEKKQLEEKIHKVLRNVLNDFPSFSEKTIKLDHAENGYYLKAKLRDEKVIRRNKNYTVIGSVASGVRFTNSKLASLSERYNETNKNYKEIQATIVKEVIEVAAGYANTLRNINIYIATIDVLVSFANVAANAPTPFIKPKLLKEGSGVLHLKRVRHPCLELENDITFIPNDIEFRKDDKTFYIITGPNMGGKSTFIRSISVAVYLAHIGSLVPCSEAEISIVDCILIRIGAEDCPMKGLSTFMVEMIETATCVKCATSNSLVVIDELGRGTSTFDGCGIAWSIAEHLTKEVKCFSLFATHFNEITQLAEKYSTICNVHVTVVTTDKTITPLFQVRAGPCDKSFGIQCAQMAGFAPDFVDLASQYLQKFDEISGMKYITNFETTLKRKVLQEGDAVIHECLNKCKTIDLDTVSDEELADILNKIKEELPKDNLFIKGLLEQ